MIVEFVGILATVFIIIAFMLEGELKIRIVDLLGAILFVVYGILIGSFSVILLNSILIGIQVYKIRKLSRNKVLESNE